MCTDQKRILSQLQLSRVLSLNIGGHVILSVSAFGRLYVNNEEFPDTVYFLHIFVYSAGLKEG